jgi:hypothetical protein
MRRLRQLQGGEDLALAGRRERALGDPTFARLQGHEVHALELVAHASPALPGSVLDEADEEQGEPAELHVGADAVLAVVETGRRRTAPLRSRQPRSTS